MKQRVHPQLQLQEGIMLFDDTLNPVFDFRWEEEDTEENYKAEGDQEENRAGQQP